MKFSKEKVLAKQAEQMAALGNAKALPRFEGTFEMVETFPGGTVLYRLAEADDACGVTNDDDTRVFVTKYEHAYLQSQKGKSLFYVSYGFIPGTQTLDKSRKIIRMDNEEVNKRNAAELSVSDMNNRNAMKANLLLDETSPYSIAIRAKVFMGKPKSSAGSVFLAEVAKQLEVPETKVTNAPKPVGP